MGQSSQDGGPPPAAREDETIGERLRRLRLDRGLSQRELASPGVSYAYVSRIEAGTRQPSVKALRKLAERLGVTADYLETGAVLAPAKALELRLAYLELAARLDDEEGAGAAAAEEALASGDAEAALRARVALALVARARGEVARAVSVLEAALAGRFEPVHEADAHLALGDAYLAAGRPEQAVRLAEQALDSVGGPGEASVLERRYASLLARALEAAGEHDRAAQVAASLGAQPDAESQARLFRWLARLADADGRSELALRHARRALALLDSGAGR